MIEKNWNKIMNMKEITYFVFTVLIFAPYFSTLGFAVFFFAGHWKKRKGRPYKIWYLLSALCFGILAFLLCLFLTTVILGIGPGRFDDELLCPPIHTISAYLFP